MAGRRCSCYFLFVNIAKLFPEVLMEYLRKVGSELGLIIEVLQVIQLSNLIETLKHSNTIKESLLLGSLFLYNLSLGWKFFFLGIIYLFIILAIYNSFYLGIGLVETYFILIEQTIKPFHLKRWVWNTKESYGIQP